MSTKTWIMACLLTFALTCRFASAQQPIAGLAPKPAAVHRQCIEAIKRSVEAAVARQYDQLPGLIATASDPRERTAFLLLPKNAIEIINKATHEIDVSTSKYFRAWQPKLDRMHVSKPRLERQVTIINFRNLTKDEVSAVFADKRLSAEDLARHKKKVTSKGKLYDCRVSFADEDQQFQLPVIVCGNEVFVDLLSVQAVDSRAQITDAQRNLKTLKQCVAMYQIRMNALPGSLEELRDGPSDPREKNKWVAPIMTKIPSDPWGNEFIYQRNENRFEIRSAGPDGKANNDDDIIVR